MVEQSSSGSLARSGNQPVSDHKNSSLNRRALLRGGLLSAAVVGAGTLSGCSEGQAVAQSAPLVPPSSPNAGDVFGASPSVRAGQAEALKSAAAQTNFSAHALSIPVNNGDEENLPNFIGSFSKSLQHNSYGEVDQASYESFLTALQSGNPTDFDNIIVGNPGLSDRIGLVSPQGAYSFELLGLDGQGARLDAAPRFESAETAAEMVELYWYALCRDVPFANYSTDPLIAAAVADLNSLSRADIFPQEGGAITPQTIFRGKLPGATTGPMLSQFLVRPFKFGAFDIDQRYARAAEGSVNEFMTDFSTYLAIQNGAPPAINLTFDNSRRYLYSMRQLGEFVHVDFPIQCGTYAAAILNELGAYDDTNPYLNNPTQDSFVNFGKADMLHIMSQAPRHALTAAWFQKWLVNRRVRPEAFACRVNVQQRGLRAYNIHTDVLNSDALSRINAQQSNADNRGLLPMGYPEGSPAHPAYPGGHSAFSAAAVTILKAFFDEDFVIPDPVLPTSDGFSLASWTGAPLTVGGELNKLVCNITHGRDGAGMHYRSDGLGNYIGEDIGVSILSDYSRTYNEQFSGFELTRFNGTKIRIQNGVVSAI